MIRKIKNKGQSLVEVVVALGIIMLVLASVVSLMVKSLSSRSAGFDRNKASELGQKVMDGLIEQRAVDAPSFWNPNSSFWLTNLGADQTMANYPNYTYTITWSQVVNGPNCPAAPFACGQATIGVGWSSNVAQQVSFSRFFRRE